ncbi:transposase [Streptomyces similanensis]|uniref:Transposase IS204/IS1001/IS1096/IS1165 DDE domain-containing protein n=1 Tax=Streptomyces similanensis TaxID=1274988 RepID=A0ABP9KSJ6_9ACTN
MVGEDECAQHKGRIYGTVLVHVETRRPVCLLPDRETDAGTAWLAERPGIEIICSDRAPFFADGATRGAPQALRQVADRWPLWHNLDAAAEKCVHRRRGCLRPLSACRHSRRNLRRDRSRSRRRPRRRDTGSPNAPGPSTPSFMAFVIGGRTCVVWGRVRARAAESWWRTRRPSWETTPRSAARTAVHEPHAAPVRVVDGPCMTRIRLSSGRFRC